MTRVFRRGGALVIAALVLALTATVASADGPGWKTVQEFPGPIFGVNAGSGDNLLVAGPEGPVKLDPDDGDTQLIASIPGLSEVIQTGRREYYVLTGEGERTPEDGPCPAMALCRVKNGNVTLVADIYEWELDNDPDGSGNVPGEDSISNPFDLSKLGRKFLVADAGGNNIQVIDKNGNIELLAVLPYEDLPTQPLKDAAGCPNAASRSRVHLRTSAGNSGRSGRDDGDDRSGWCHIRGRAEGSAGAARDFASVANRTGRSMVCTAGRTQMSALR